MRASFFIVRHGSTSANNPAAERIRGWAPIPLSLEGEMQAKAAGRFLLNRGNLPTRIWHSPLKRVTQTAAGVNASLKLEKDNVVKHGSLLDWNTGCMEGMYVDAVKPFLDFYQRNPNLLIPQGESYREFWDRWKKCFRDCCDFAIKNRDEKLLIVTHARNIVTLQHWLKKRPIGPVSYDDVPKPGSVLEVILESPTEVRLRTLKGGKNHDIGP